MITLLPTLNRLKLLTRFLESANNCETTTDGLVIVDRADWTKNAKGYQDVMLRLPNGWAFALTEAVKMGDKVREVWPDVKNYDAINLLNDDHVICTPKWDQILLSKIDGTNFVTCNDNWMSPAKAAGATVFSRELLEAVGIPIYPPGMMHLFIDDLWETIGRGTGCWEVTHEVLIEHHNQLRDPKGRDSTFHEVYGRGPDIRQHELWRNDEKAYHDFIKSDYNRVRNAIRLLRGQIEIVTHA